MTKDLIPKTITGIQIFQENGLDPLLEAIGQKIKDFKPNVSSVAGRKEIASFAYKIAQSKTFIDKAGKSLVADQKAAIKKIDAERKRCREWLDEKKEEVRKPLTEYEEAEKQKALEKKMLADWDEAITENNLFDRAREVERKEAALAAAEQERKEKEEAERLEKERLEREERLKKEAAEEAKREAEQKIKDAQAAKERAEREKEEAARLAEENRIKAVERAEIEKEMAIKKAKEAAEAFAKAEREADEARKEKERAAAEKKAANKKHRAKINKSIYGSLDSLFRDNMCAGGIDKDFGKKLIEAIAKGEIKYLQINY